MYAGGKDICGYFPLYERHLPKTVENFLEIGIAMGISIKMFRDYYEGKGTFHALNNFWGNAGVIPMSELTKLGFVCYDGQQEDVKFLSTIDMQFDVIIDDGSHRSDHQTITFNHLFTHNLKSGGLYVIEDLHCCFDPYWWGDVTRFEDTMLYRLINFDKVINYPIENVFAKQWPARKEVVTFEEPINVVYLYNPSIAFIYKK